MALVITNGICYIYRSETGKIKKTEYIDQAEDFSTLGEAIKLFKMCSGKTKDYCIYDTESEKVCYHRGGRFRKKYSLDTKRMIYHNAAGRCVLCGRKIKFEDMTLDHIIPLAMGGVDKVENLQCTCSACNLFKGSVLPEDFFERITDIYMFQLEKKLGNGIKWKVVQCILGK